MINFNNSTNINLYDSFIKLKYRKNINEEDEEFFDQQQFPEENETEIYFQNNVLEDLNDPYQILKWTRSYNFNLWQYFKIPYENWIAIIYYFGKELHIPPSDINEMPFFDIIYLKEKLEEDIKEQNKQNQDQEKNQLDQQNSVQSQMNSNMSSFNNLKMPEIKMPTMPGF